MALSGRVALVTGSTSGIGLGIARTLAASGAEIVLNGFGEHAEIERLRSEITAEFGVRVGFAAADIGKGEAVRAMIRDIEAAHGRLDILINNAGIQHVAPIEDFPVDRWDAILAINLSGAFHTIAAALPGMRARGWGRIVNVASAHGLVGSAHKAAYVAAKHGILGLTKVTALETANSGITANAICPGWVLTPLVERQLQDRAARHGTSVEAEKAEFVREKQPLEEFSTPEQIGALAAFLCSDAARTMTGTALPVDGGWTAR
ncbi:MAG: 3-hydroxybutyrate dehydrogenase [Rhodospirillales bacterium]|jgi:3-hydroxybutyrate dehydrogenase